MIKGKDNTLLVEFEFVVDLDMAMFKFIKENYFSSPMVHHDFLSLNDEFLISYNMLNRSYINPLIYIIPDMDTDQMYYDLLNDPVQYSMLLTYAKVYDTFGLMITFLREASSVSIDILCRNDMEKEFINNLNPILSTVVEPDKSKIDLSNYTALYIKYFENAKEYVNLEGKHIYIPAARYNMEPGQDTVNIELSGVFGELNEIHLIDLYRYVKYRFHSRKVDDSGNVVIVEESNNNKEETNGGDLL